MPLRHVGMGKVKFKKLKSLRHNPVDLPSADDLSKMEIAEDSLQDQSAPVLSKVGLQLKKKKKKNYTL